MSNTLLKTVALLRSSPPIDCLSKAHIEALAQTAKTVRYSRGQHILTVGQANRDIFLIAEGAVIIKNADGELVNQLDAGGWFGHSAWFNLQVMPNTVSSSEDCLLYAFPMVDIARLMQQYEVINNYFSLHSHHHLHQANEPSRDVGQPCVTMSQIERLKQRTSLQVTPHTSISETAQLMTKERRSAALIIDDRQLQGIVTESDLCRFVIAEGVDSSTPINQIMTPSPVLATGEISATDALILMAKHAIHHLPFQRQDGAFSTLTATDLIQLQSHNPLFLITDIYGSLTLNELKQHSKKIPALLTDLVNAGLVAHSICHLMSAVGEAINQRLLQLAEQKLGQPPVAYGWLVAGSLGRREQTAFTDQDNALILADDYDEDEHQPYFNALATFVCNGLHDCGYFYCPGGIMATNPNWQLTAIDWQQQFLQWINNPIAEALLYTNVFFDMRTIYGDTTLLARIMPKVLATAPKQAPFMRHLTTNALNFSPPLGIFRHFVLEKTGAEEKALNLKKRGVTPIIELARTYALASGEGTLNTQSRINAAIHHGKISAQAGADLIAAFAFINSVRLQHQAKQIAASQSPDNFISPASLSSLERKYLKDAFFVVANMQKFLNMQFQ